MAFDPLGPPWIQRQEGSHHDQPKELLAPFHCDGLACVTTGLLGCSDKKDLKEEVIGKWRNTHVWKNEGDERHGYVKGEYYTDTLEIFEGGTGNWSCIRDSTGEELKGWMAQWEVEDDVFNLIIPSMLGSVTYGY